MKKEELPFDVDLKGKVAVVTGAGGFICSTLASALAACGAKVALLDLREEKAQEKADEIVKDGYIAKGYGCNVLDRAALEETHKRILNDFGPCDILINGAGGNNPRATTDNEFASEHDLDEGTKSFFGLEDSGIQFVFNLNILGTLLPTQVFAADMIKAKKGNIINISSMNAFTPLTKIPAYSAAKAGVSNLTKWLAVYFSKMNIRVNAVAPGFLVTAQNQALLYNLDGTPTARTAKILRNTPMERFGKLEELVGGFLFFVSDKASSFITGVVLPIDGGFSAYSGV